MTKGFDIKDLYLHLGKLTYAVAIADGRVQQEEINDLHKLIRNEFVSLEKATDEFDTNLAFYTEFEFETRVDSQTSKADVYDAFISFLREHREHITPEIKELCVNSVLHIAEAYGGVVEKEKEFLQKLQSDLDKL